jgi:hypothetical protein
MARERSPNYPAYPLPAAIHFAKMVWDKEKRTPVEIDVLASALGSRVVSGPVRSKVAAMRHYGLLHFDKGSYRVTDRALTLILQRPGQLEYDRAAAEAAISPPLFKELTEDRTDASDDALNFYLVRDRKFSPDGAKRVIKSYRETLAFAKLDGMSYPGEDEVNDPGDRSDDEEEPRHDPDGVLSAPPRPDFKYVTFSFSLPSGVKAEVSFSGRTPPTKRDAQKLRQYLELFEDDLDQPQPPSTIKFAIADEVDLT